jgi:hypothetical protein
MAWQSLVAKIFPCPESFIIWTCCPGCQQLPVNMSQLHGAEPFLRRLFQHFMRFECSLPCSQKPTTFFSLSWVILIQSISLTTWDTVIMISVATDNNRPGRPLLKDSVYDSTRSNSSWKLCCTRQRNSRILQYLIRVSDSNCGAGECLLRSVPLFLILLTQYRVHCLSRAIRVGDHTAGNFVPRIAVFVDCAHHPEFKITRKQHFGNWIWFRLQVRGGRHIFCWVP